MQQRRSVCAKRFRRVTRTGRCRREHEVSSAGSFQGGVRPVAGDGRSRGHGAFRCRRRPDVKKLPFLISYFNPQEQTVERSHSGARSESGCK